MQPVLSRIRDERGVALITVIGVAATMFVLAAVIAVGSVNDLRQAREERAFEQAIHAADAGVDHVLFRLTEDHHYDTADDLPPGGFDSAEAEKEWVLDQAETATVLNGRLHSVPEGEWVAIKPDDEQVIYSVGYIPSKDNPEEVRVIRAEYDFGPFIPSKAFLLGSDLTISGNPLLDGSLHVNGNLLITGTPEVGGCVSSSGSYNVGGAEIGDLSCSGGGMTPLEVYEVVPRDLYDMSQYDMCPDGVVRAGPAYPGPEANTSDTPCLGDVLGSAVVDAYRGWNFASLGANWKYDTGEPYDGTYYFYLGNVEVDSNPGMGEIDPWEVSIIAEPSGASCPHIGGDIKVAGNPSMRYHASAQPMALVAGRDLEISGNPDIEGALVVHEQVKISGNPSILGSIVAEDACDTVGSPVNASQVTGNPDITGVAGQELPGRAIRTTLWLEL